MIAYKCDVCKEEVVDRKTVKVDGREYDLCSKCHAKTVGKLTGGRLVFESLPQPVYVPWYVPTFTQPLYQPPVWFYPTIAPTINPAPSLPVIYCNEFTTYGDGQNLLTQ